MVKRVCLVSSGTGGHLLPAMVLSEALRQRGHGTLLLTEGRSVEKDMLAAIGEPSRSLSVGRLGPGLPLRLVRATWQARRLLKEEHIDLVVSAGGRTSLPTALAARSLGLPVCLLEQNAVTGRANRLLGPLARRIYYGLPQARAPRHGLLTGTPMRKDIGRGRRATARAELGLDPNAATILVTGGSQGAQSINEAVPDAIRNARRSGHLQVLHVAGAGADDRLRAHYDGMSNLSARVFSIAMNMATLYAASSLVICRGGGGTVAELMMAGRPAVVVPYPHHRDRQQWHNANVLKSAGAAVIVGEDELSKILATTIEVLLAEPERLRKMGERARQLAPSDDPAQRIVADMQEQGVLD